MRPVPLLAVDATEVFDEIAAAKHQPRRGRMRAARGEVLAAYQGYEGAVPEVGGLDEAPLTDLQKEAMRHAFTSLRFRPRQHPKLWLRLALDFLGRDTNAERTVTGS